MKRGAMLTTPSGIKGVILRYENGKLQVIYSGIKYILHNIIRTQMYANTFKRFGAFTFILVVGTLML